MCDIIQIGEYLGKEIHYKDGFCVQVRGCMHVVGIFVQTMESRNVPGLPELRSAIQHPEVLVAQSEQLFELLRSDPVLVHSITEENLRQSPEKMVSPREHVSPLSIVSSMLCIARCAPILLLA